MKGKQGLLLDPNPGPHAHILVLGPSQECLWHRHIVMALINPNCNNSFLFYSQFRNFGFDQTRSQPQFSLFTFLLLSYNNVFDLAAPPARPPPPSSIMYYSDPLYMSTSARDWATLLDPPTTSPGSAAVSDLADHLSWVPLSRGWVGAYWDLSRNRLAR